MKHILSILFIFLISITKINAQDLVKYQAAQYPEGQKALNTIVAKNIYLSKKLFSTMVENNILEVRATVALIINSKGKMVDFEILETSHPSFDESSFSKLKKAFKDTSFIPGSINGNPTATSLIVKDIIASIRPAN